MGASGLKTCLAAQTEGEPCLAERRVVGVGEVIAVPEDDFGVHGRVDVMVHAQELEVVAMNFLVRIVVFVADTQGVLLVDVEAGFNGEQHLVVCHELGLGRVALVGNGVEVGQSEVENGVVHARFEQEGVDTLSLVRVESPYGVDAVVEILVALGVVDFGTEDVGVGPADFGTEHPVEARGDDQVLVSVVDERKAVGGEEGYGVVGRIGCAQVQGAASVLVVTDIEADTAEVLFTDDDGVTGSIAPEVVVEGARAVSHVAEDKGDFVADIPAELDSVKFKGIVAAIRTHGGGTGKSVADFGFLEFSVFVDKGAVGRSLDDDGDVFVEVRLQGEVDVLVAGVSRVKIAVKVAGVVHVHVAVDFDIGGGSDGGGGHGQGQNQFAHTFFPIELNFS